jgi:NAD(P)-dependent dehydrogenase (short-subunit alcohol dehydrogenase family)
MPRILITGANRGIGLEFVRQYAEAGWEVLATCRAPAAAADLQALAARHAHVRVELLDLASAASIQSLAGRVADHLAGLPGDGDLDVLLHNAALLGPGSPQLLGSFQESAFLEAFCANALGPALLTERLLPLVAAGGQKKIVFLGSAAGAIGLLQPPANLYAYRSSKAALHLLARNFALDLKARGVVVGLVNPGLVDTRGLLDLAGDDPGPPDLQHLVKLVRAGVVPLIRPAASVAGMRALIDGWTLDQTGVFLNYDGQPLPW